jgi:hypothetical protein
VSVRELADPSTVEMGEAASPSAGCSEVDADVVQIEATLRILHLATDISPFVSAVPRPRSFARSAIKSGTI